MQICWVHVSATPRRCHARICQRWRAKRDGDFLESGKLGHQFGESKSRLSHGPMVRAHAPAASIALLTCAAGGIPVLSSRPQTGYPPQLLPSSAPASQMFRVHRMGQVILTAMAVAAASNTFADAPCSCSQVRHRKFRRAKDTRNSAAQNCVHPCI